ncbi:MAG: response regulator transcription factor [Sarcina sp.]
MNILIADDEKQMTNIINLYLKKEGFNVFIANDGDEALKLFYENKIDIAILDWMMPFTDGVEVCKEIKKNSNTKVIMLTAKDTVDDELLALRCGADDYIKKPFDPRILIARAKKMISVNNILKFAEFKIDLQSKKFFKGDEEIELARREFDLLMCFYNNKGNILTRDKLLDLVWGLDYYGDYRTVDTHIYRLREKIGKSFIKTRRGMGYCFDF